MDKPNRQETEWQLLARYLEGTCTSEEKSHLAKWFRADPDRQCLLQQLERIWKAAAEAWYSEAMDEEIIQKDWQRLRSQMGTPALPGPASPPDTTSHDD